MDLGGLSRSLLLCLLLGCPKNLLNFALANPGSPSAEQTSLKGAETATNRAQEICAKSEPELDVTKISIVTLDPKDNTKKREKDSSQYDLKNKNELLEYKLKPDAKCVGLKIDGNDVWKCDYTDPNIPYPESVVVNVKVKILLFTTNDSLNVYEIDGNELKTVFSGKPQTVTLDTKTKANGNGFTYSKKDKVGTYTANRGKFFNVVKAKSNKIWGTENKTEYATKVVVSGIGSKTKTFTIYMVNGKTVEFNKDKNTRWEGETPSSNESSGLKIVTKDPSNPNDTKDNDKTQYIVSKTDSEYFYEFKPDAKCVGLKIDGNDVWNYGKEGYKEYAKSIRYMNTHVLITLETVRIIYEKKGNDWAISTDGIKKLHDKS